MAKCKKRSRAHRKTGPIHETFFPAYRPVCLAALGFAGLGPAGAAAFPATLELSALDGTNGFRIDGVSPFDRSGSAVSAAGDVNGDGIADLLIGASYADLDPKRHPVRGELCRLRPGPARRLPREPKPLHP